MGASIPEIPFAPASSLRWPRPLLTQRTTADLSEARKEIRESLTDGIMIAQEHWKRFWPRNSASYMYKHHLIEKQRQTG